jgi:hypothetical protein
MSDYYVQAPSGQWYAVSPLTGQAFPISTPPPTAPPAQIISIPVQQAAAAAYAETLRLAEEAKKKAEEEAKKKAEEEAKKLKAKEEEEKRKTEAEKEEAEEEEKRKEEEKERQEKSRVPSPSGILGSIIGFLGDVSEFFYNAYLRVYDWVWPFYLLALPLYSLSKVFSDLSWKFLSFSYWLDEVADRVSSAISWDSIVSALKGWLPWLVNLGDWFQNWWSNVTSAITSWWGPIWTNVQMWISTALQWLNSAAATFLTFWNNLWPYFQTVFNKVKAEWDNFWKVTVPNLVDNFSLETWWEGRLKDVNKLINDKVKDWFPFYDDLMKLWKDIALFFTSPLTWLIKKLEDWFWDTEES